MIYCIVYLLIGLFPYVTKLSLSEESEIKLRTKNHNVSLFCETDRRLDISWERDNGIIPHTASGLGSNVLTLINLRPEDAGSYRCVAKDLFFGNCSSDYVKITINGNTQYTHTYTHVCILE